MPDSNFISKYSSLRRFLFSSGKDYLTLTFSRIEEVLGFELPKSAYKHNAWWANGSHAHADAWLSAGYKVEQVNLDSQRVSFRRGGNKVNLTASPKLKSRIITDTAHINFVHVDPKAKTLSVYGYQFVFIQQIIPECDVSGEVVKFYPQQVYDNKNNLPLSHHGNGAFCRFSINAGDWPGVYLWVVDNNIIYIGETDGLRRRFNMGYGNISPRNCYVGGQTTNCKMNKVALSLFEQGMIISLYFYKTTDYKRVELELLRKIITPYNVKNN